VIPNVLAARYASPQLVALWSPENKIVLERRLWIAVLRAQRDLLDLTMMEAALRIQAECVNERTIAAHKQLLQSRIVVLEQWLQRTTATLSLLWVRTAGV